MLIKKCNLLILFLLVVYSCYAQFDITINETEFRKNIFKGEVVFNNNSENECVVYQPFINKQLVMHLFSINDILECSCTGNFCIVFTDKDTLDYCHSDIYVNSMILFRIKKLFFGEKDAPIFISEKSQITKKVLYDFRHIDFNKENGNKYYFQLVYYSSENNSFIKSNVVELEPNFDKIRKKPYYRNLRSQNDSGFFWKLKHGALFIKEE